MLHYIICFARYLYKCKICYAEYFTGEPNKLSPTPPVSKLPLPSNLPPLSPPKPESQPGSPGPVTPLYEALPVPVPEASPSLPQCPSTPKGINIKLLSRIITLPSVKYSGQVEADVIESQLGWGEAGRKPACHKSLMLSAYTSQCNRLFNLILILICESHFDTPRVN